MKSWIPVNLPSLCLAFILVLFAGLVAGGMTGSSVGALYTEGALVSSDARTLAGLPRAIRSDEWGVITPMAIGQVSHHPQLPILNRNIGPEGQNMLIVGMSGVPVSHLSSIAKPATWGFHLFDLRRALAWYWWFPVFACWLAVWWMLCLLVPQRPMLGLLTSTLFLCSPYVAAWSYWPAYAVFFPAFSLCMLLLILKQPGRLANLVLGAALGVGLAGFVLLLYPPWQVSLGFLFLLLVGAHLWDRRRTLSIDLVLIASLLIAASVTLLILWQWWLDARDAVMAMLDTLYPGRRVSETGGGFSLAVLLRGFTNLTSMFAVDFGGGPMNQSEAASFHYLFLPLLAALGFRGQAAWRDRIVQVLLLFIAWGLLFIFKGIPLAVANLSLWGRVPSIRVELCLGLAYTLLCGRLLMLPVKISSMALRRAVWLGTAVSLLWACIVVIAVSVFPESVQGGWRSWARWATFGLTFLAGVWLINGRIQLFFASSLFLALLTVGPFNPWSIAPSQVELTNPQALSAITWAERSKRVLVIGDHFQAMALMSAGVPVVNGIHYYPQASLWKQLDPAGLQRDIYNRYQHLSFTTGVVETQGGLDLKTPSADQVLATIDPAVFDFVATGATHVLAPTSQSEALGRSGQLTRMLASADWVWWRIGSRCGPGVC